MTVTSVTKRGAAERIDPYLLVRRQIITDHHGPTLSVHVQAVVDDVDRSRLLTCIGFETLIKKPIMVGALPFELNRQPNGLPNNPKLANFLTNDDSLEITVRGLLTGQRHVTESLWEILAFEFIARHGFDMLLELMGVLDRFGEDIRYLGAGRVNEQVAIEEGHVAHDHLRCGGNATNGLGKGPIAVDPLETVGCTSCGMNTRSRHDRQAAP